MSRAGRIMAAPMFHVRPNSSRVSSAAESPDQDSIHSARHLI
jgi:hypothetical protein